MVYSIVLFVQLMNLVLLLLQHLNALSLGSEMLSNLAPSTTQSLQGSNRMSAGTNKRATFEF